MKYKAVFMLLVLSMVSVFGVTIVGAQDGYNESPMLAALVEAGELPPVAERLPENPQVVEPFKEVGQYGGALRVGFTGANPGWGGLWYIAGWENLVSWAPDFSGVIPNIAESWDISDDVSEYTFHIRKGIKWSDGVEFTADDIMFYIEDVLFNEELSPSGPIADWLPREGMEDFKAEKIDDYTVKFHFAAPNGTFMLMLPTWSGRHITWFPRHFLEQYHADYNPDVADLVAAEDGVEDWVSLFDKKASGPIDDTNNYWNILERPVLHPWVATSILGGSPQMSMERNPYYWKVDTEGNQLPYIDNIVGITYQDNEARTLAMINGDLDYVKDPGDDNRILYYDAIADGAPLAMSAAMSDGGNTNSIHFNRTIGDPVLAEIFSDLNFRIGMSHAINRQEIIEIVHFGQVEPAQVAPLEDSPLYNEQLATQYLEYNLDLANEYLDKVVPERDAEGYRLRPDGQRLSIVFTVSNDLGYGTNWVQVSELLLAQWEKVGIEFILNSVSDELFIQQKEQNQVQATIYTGEGGAGLTGIMDVRYYVPLTLFGTFGNAWYYAFNKVPDTVHIDPPQEILDIYAEYQKVLATPGQEAQIEAMLDVLQTAADNFWVIGISRPVPGFQPYNVRVGNQPDEWIAGWLQGVQKITFPEQWYIIQ